MIKKHRYQVNLHFGERRISAYGLNGLVTGRGVGDCVRRIIQRHKVPAELIELTFQPEDDRVHAYTVDRKIMKALRLVFGRRLGSMKEMPEEKRLEALEALKSARRNLVEYRTRHPELLNTRATQETLAL